MSTAPPPHGDRDFDEEFARLVEAEGGEGDLPGPAPVPPADAEPAAERIESAPAAPPDDEDEELALPGDFEEPDPDLPSVSPAVLWSWVAFLGGLALLLVVVFSATLPLWLSWLGGAASLGGLVSLLLHVPRERSGPEDGIEV